MPYDNRIVPGAWVMTRFGKAVCIAVEPHKHRVGPPEHLVGPDGICHCACEDDSCKDAMYVGFRYRARRYTHDANGKINGQEDHDIWVGNGDLSGDKEWEVKFLKPPTTFTARILKLTGPYGEGKPACGPYIDGYCACGEPIHA